MIDTATPTVPFQSDARPANALASGCRLDEYRIDTILGAGGFGVTYKAWDTLLETWVAIKEYFPVEWSFRDADGVTVHSNAQGGNTGGNGQMSEYLWGLERFLDEARVLARVQHPFVVRVKRYFRAHGTAYIVMDYEEGESLNAVLQDSDTLSEDELRGLLEDVLPALQAVHEQGFLHRDIKPSNLYVRASDHRVILIDFGAAREAVGRHSKNIISLVTPGYSPPEQYAARNDRHGPWSDIYALGAVLYRCVTGDPPVEAAERLLDDSMEPAARACAGRYSAGLLRMIDRALAVRPEHRFNTVAEMQAALNESLVNEQDADDTLILGPLARPSNKSTQPTLSVLPATESLLATESVMLDDDDLRLLPPLETERHASEQQQGMLQESGYGEPRGSSDTADGTRRRFWLPLLGGGLTLAITAVALVWLWPKAPPERPPAVVRSSPATPLQPTKPAVIAVAPPSPSIPAIPAPDPAAINPTVGASTAASSPSIATPPVSPSPSLAVQPASAPEPVPPALPTPTPSPGEPAALTEPPVVKTPISEPAVGVAPTESPGPEVAPTGTRVAPVGEKVGVRDGTIESEAVAAPPTGNSQKPAPAVTGRSSSPKSASTVKLVEEPDIKPAGKGMVAGKGNARPSEADTPKSRTARRQAAKKRSRTQPVGVAHGTAAPAKSTSGPIVANPWETPTSTGFNSK